MNEGMFIALRGLGQETNSLLQQILAEQKRMNELLAQLAAEKKTDSATHKDLQKLYDQYDEVMNMPLNKLDEKIKAMVATTKATPKKGK